MVRFLVVVACSAIMLASCAADGVPGTAAPNFQQVAGPTIPDRSQAQQDYRIGPLDRLDVSVFQVKDLEVQKAQVDAGGRISLPLVGTLVASGKTAQELQTEITTRLTAYLQHPQVTVVVEEAVNQKVTVEGSVKEPGVFELKGRTTLLQAVAMGKGTDRDADLNHVAIFRTINGQRQGAVFNLDMIRNGKASDPDVYGNDVVVVGASAAKGAWHEFLTALPGLAIFRPY
jgi:polysaccharide export outer membrane protein